MASPSQIPGHQQSAAVDSAGNQFPSGTTFYLNNVCSGGEQALAFDTNLQEAITGQTQDVADRKWSVEFEGNDRSKVAFKNSASGGYLAATGPGHESKMWLSDTLQWWYVYQGSKLNTFWFGTTQSPDAYLYTQDCSEANKSKVVIFTNRDSGSGRFYKLKYPAFEEYTSGLSWSLQPATSPDKTASKNDPQTGKNKAATPNGESQASPKDAGDAKLKERDQALADREKALADREARAQKAETDLQQRTDALQRKEAEHAPKDADLQERTAALQRQQDDLSAREEKVAAAEKRIKKNKTSGPADLLAAHQDVDRLQDELAQLKKADEKQRAELAALQKEVEQLRRQPPAAAASSSQGVIGGPAATLRSSIGARKPLREPQKLTPPTATPKQARPARATPTGFTPALSKKMEDGKKSLASLRERRPPQTAVV